LTFTFTLLKVKEDNKMNMKLFKIKSITKRRKNGEKGQALLIVLVLMLVGLAIITSTLIFMGTTLKTNKVYIDNTTSLYAAEAGIQDGIWNILNNTSASLAGLLTTVLNNPLETPSANPNPTIPYTDYNFNPYGWYYNLYNPAAGNTTPITINSFNPVDVTITNTWVPLIDNLVPAWIPTSQADISTHGFINPPSVDQAENILSNFGGTANTNLVVTGDASTVPLYKLYVTYTGTSSLPVLSIGCWLPQGFTYNNGSSTLKDKTTGNWLYSTEQVLKCAGNEAVVWTFPSGTTFNDLFTKMAGQSGNSLAINFGYTTSLSKLPEALGWIVDTPNADFPYNYTWNADVTVHDMIASAGNTAIEAFVPRSQTRMLGNAISGDYVATGGSNLTDADHDGQGLREHYIASSSSTVNTVPPTATVEAAYLYWAGWLRDSTATGQLYDPSVTLVVNSSSPQTIDFSTPNSEDVHWDEKVKSGRGGTISITAGNINVTGLGTNFTSTAASQGVSVGGQITPDSGAHWYTVASVTDNTHLKLTVAPGVGETWSGVQYNVFDGYYYACKKDVTDIVRNLSTGANLAATPKVYGCGNGTYAVSDLYSDIYCVQDQTHPGGATEICTSAYAGWSLVIIYSDVSTLGHQLYLFDEFESISNTSGNNPIPISGFIIPQPVSADTGQDAIKLTVFVGEGDTVKYNDHVGLIPQSGAENVMWDGVLDDPNDTQANPNDAFNGESINGASTSGGYLNASGIDIDTFHIPWSPVIVKPNDTVATINLYTNGDGIVSIYVLASFRSAITSGGSISYLIKRKNAP
jgi:hypothetical protein